MGDTMFMPETWEEFLRDYEFKDRKEIYTNGSMLIQSFRVKQMMEHYARPKHGRWELGIVKPGYFTPGGNRPWVCSECGWLESWMFDKPKANYCSNCGAKMDGGGDDQA